ncbi:MAG: UPF0182 family protein, partial [Solirubrobacteraceae bacterium]
MPPEDDPIIRGLRSSGIRPLGERRGLPPILVGLLGVVILFILFPTIAARLADWLWYREIGFERVFLTKIVAQWTLALSSGLIAFAFLYANARIAARGADTVQVFRQTPKIGRALGAVLARGTGFFALAASIVIAFLVGLGVAAQWRTLLQFAYRTPFGVTDPIFHRDVGFYVFTLPVIELALGVATICALLALVAIALPIHIA